MHEFSKFTLYLRGFLSNKHIDNAHEGHIKSSNHKKLRLLLC